MSELYYLMRKNDKVTVVRIDELGNINRSLAHSVRHDIAPMANRYKDTWLKEWWMDRAIPSSRNNIRKLLLDVGVESRALFLTKNLGLSLTDYYWIKPMDSDLKWEDVNLFDNAFENDTMDGFTGDSLDKKELLYSPNSSLQGDIEKTWAIRKGERYLIKGNNSFLSSESINEVLASEIHKRQGYDNYTDYELIKINGKSYDYGCICKAFTSQKYELIPAWDIYSYKKKANNESVLQHILNVCKSFGMDVESFKRDLDYEIMVDFIMSGYDRHLNNFGVLRDAETLELVRMAPIYDSGGALFANHPMPMRLKDLLDLKTNSFASNEQRLLKTVDDYSVVDLDKLPPVSFVKKLYEKDSQIEEKRLASILFAYEKKIDICRDIQKGKDPWSKKYAVSGDSGLFAKEEEFDYEPAKGSVN